ncbi:MAG: hypothetical protein FJ301_08005 [Planctomycetes bacterium]|nr:hypothetical protein [Planctomycetota bacterium]
MNFTRTNLSPLLARQTRQTAQRGVVAMRRAVLPPTDRRATSLGNAACEAAVAADTPMSAREILEFAGTVAMMAFFMVLALFG